MPVLCPRLTIILLISSALLPLTSQAADFTIVNGQTVTTKQTLTADETGVIETGGTLDVVALAAIAATGDNTTITNSGTITSSSGTIDSFGANTTITNTGTITAGGDSGVRSIGANATITNSGTITAGDDFGIYSFSANATITNSGTITAGNDRGIYSAGAQATITNSGTITAGDNYGIYSFGDDATISNSGTISASGNNGVYVSGDDATISNSGTISAAGDNGVHLVGANATITNSGTITVAGDKGVHSSYKNATISNSGTITAGGNNGVRSTGINATISNSGTITVGADNGIYSFGNKATINNSGTITAGNDFGIFSNGATAIINNSGTITAANYAINSSGNNTVINNSGTIRATDAGGLAVRAFSNDVTLNLLAGSQIIGGIDLGSGGDNDTVNIYGGSVSANLTLLNVENINVLGAAAIVNGNNVVTIDPTAEVARSSALSGTTSAIHNTVSQRAGHKAPFKPVQVASLTLSPGMLFQQRTPTAWAQAFGGISNHDAEGSSMAYGSSHVGFTLGYEWDIDQTRVGLLGGVVRSNTKTDMASSQTESDSYYIGGYGLFSFDSFNLSTSLIGGYASNDNKRLVIDSMNGVEVAKSDFSSVFISPSVTISSAYAVADKLELRPSVSLNYSMARLDDYQEQGTTNSNLSIDDRTLKVATARAQIAAAYQLDDYSEFSFRVGVSSRHSNDDDIDGNLAGNSFSFTNAGDENVTGKFAGINLRVANQNNLTLVMDMEFGGSSKEDYTNGEISLAYNF